MSKIQKPKIIAGAGAQLARRYALALLELAEEKKSVDAVAADLQALQDAITGDKLFEIFAKHPRLPSAQAVKVLTAVMDKAQFHALTRSFLLHVIKGRRLALMALIVEVFLRDLAERRGHHTAYVSAAKALSEAQEKQLASQLGTLMGGSVDVVVEESPDLLGGLVVKMGSRLIDASVKGKLERLERQLKMQQEAA